MRKIVEIIDFKKLLIVTTQNVGLNKFSQTETAGVVVK